MMVDWSKKDWASLLKIAAGVFNTSMMSLGVQGSDYFVTEEFVKWPQGRNTSHTNGDIFFNPLRLVSDVTICRGRERDVHRQQAAANTVICFA